jgi:hypothetical protein
VARCFGLAVPDWAETCGCALRQPFLARGLEGLKGSLFVQSPAVFRRRMLFASHALDRPRLQAGG